MKQGIGKGIYFENLDSLRAIAAFSVIFFHISFWFEFPGTRTFSYLRQILSFNGNGGSLGVEFFFILSGFLITYLLIAEKKESGKIDVKRFYIRRILRIWPLYYFTLLAGFVIYPALLSVSGIPYTEKASVLLYSVFAANFDHIYNGVSENGILGVQWSVAIEEQFYLLWPLLLAMFREFRKGLIAVFLVLILLSELLTYRSLEGDSAYFHFIANVRFLAFGSLMAYMGYYHKEQIYYGLQKLGVKIHFAIYVISLLLLYYRKDLSGISGLYKYAAHAVPYLFFGFVILEQNYSPNSFFKLGSVKLLNRLGKMSYGLYLLHMIAVYLVYALMPNKAEYGILNLMICIGLTLIISYLSYRYIESPFLRLKEKYKAGV